MTETAMTGEIDALVRGLLRDGSTYADRKAAADALTRLTAELAKRDEWVLHWQTKCQATNGLLQDTKAALAKAVEALEPFAEAAASYDPDEGDGANVAWSHDFTIASLRRARAIRARSTAATP